MPEEDPVHPSQRLIEYYKEKLREWRMKYIDLQRDVEACKELAEKSAAKEEESVKLLAETAGLQEALSNIRSCLYRERDHVLRLTRENDMLEVQKLEDRRKIDFLLDVAGMKESELELDEKARKTVTLMARKRVKFREVANFNKKLEKFKEESAIENLQLKVSALEAQLQEQTEHLQDEICSLKDDMELRKKEWEVQRKRLTQQIACLNCRLRNAQLFKFQEMSTYLEELNKERDRDIKLIDENDRLKRSLAICKELLGDDYPSEKEKKQQIGLRVLRDQIEQRDRVIEGYIGQIAFLGDQIRTLKAEVTSEKDGRLKERERLLSREEYYKKKMEEERKRRALESEGFMSDVKLLRSKLQSLERQMRQEQLRQRHRRDD